MNPSCHSYSSWALQKPVNYRSPSNPAELVHVKVTQFNAVVNRLASQSSARVVVDHARLTLLLTEHLSQNPAATDPFNINFRIDPTSGDIQLKHFDLEYRIPRTEQSRFADTNSAVINRLHPDTFRQVVNIVFNQNFNSVDEKANVLAAGDIVLRHDSGLAGFNLATRVAKVDLLPTPEKLHNSLGMIGGNVPEIERHVARKSLAKLITGLVQPASGQIALGLVVEAKALKKIVKTGLVFLRVLNTANPPDPVRTNTDLSIDQLCQLLTVFGAASGVFQNDRQQAIEVEQFVTHLHGKILNIQAVRSDAGWFEQMDVHLREDRDVVMAAVQQNGAALAFASDEHLNDREVVLSAVRQFGLSLEFASNELRNDRELVLAAIEQDGLALESASTDLRAERDVLLAAVRQNGFALEFGNAEHINDREVVMAAVQNNGLSLEFASDALRNDREVVMTAVCNDNCFEEMFGDERYALEYASTELRDDKEVVMAAVRKESWALRVASARLRGDRDVVMAAVQQDASALDFASDELQEDPALMMF
ncbi:DUF4116 domain-containing protein [Limnobacter sp.]|uniref:DUF4116 domain-containing protein n=1 Tax=Limnobacter sp. TaxID=2003368 RepID=UPI0027326BED|nr:DUF4116 domain-containing protein [Limnobacter sp.]MDP3189314.1 DUF4116 domain-containing protein [Limnobacter sp.]